METQTSKEVKSTLNSAHKKANHAIDRVEDSLSNYSMQDVREMIDSAVQSLRENSRYAVDRTESWVKANPYKALFGAVTFGAFIAAMMKRGK